MRQREEIHKTKQRRKKNYSLVKKKSKTKKILVRLSVSLLVLIGLVLTFQVPLTHWFVNHFQQKYALQSLSKDQLKANQKKGNFDSSNVKTVNFLDVAKAQMENHNYPVIGAIAYPELKITLPILNGDGDATMLYGAGTMKPSQVMGQGNYALASHHVSNVYGHSADGLLFSPLQNAKTGQKVYLTDKVKVYEYKTTSVRIMLPSQGNVIQDVKGKKELTLVTCYSDDRYRIIVQGTFIKAMPFNNKNAKFFTAQYTQWWK